MTCTKTVSKNDLFLNCQRKMKELLKKELSNVTPALNNPDTKKNLNSNVRLNLTLIFIRLMENQNHVICNINLSFSMEVNRPKLNHFKYCEIDLLFISING